MGGDGRLSEIRMTHYSPWGQRPSPAAQLPPQRCLAPAEHAQAQPPSHRTLVPTHHLPMPRSRPSPPTTALPWYYWVIFGLYEPLLAMCGFLGAMVDPKKVRTAFVHASGVAGDSTRQPP